MVGLLCRGRLRKSALCAPLMTLALLTGLTACTGADGGASGRAGAAAGTPPDGKGGASASPKKSPASPKKSPASPAKKDGSPSGAGSTSSKRPKAADGTDTRACADGDCEVELSKGDAIHPPSSSGVDEFKIQKIEDHVVTWTARFRGGSVTTSVRGARNSSTSCTNGSCTGTLGRSKGRIEMNELVIEFTAIGRNRAVVKVSPKE